MNNSIEQIFEFLAADPELLIPILAIGGGLFIAFTAIVVTNVAGMVRYRARERTRREIAAYIAEGSISADEGERLLVADTPKRGGCGSC